LQFLKALWPIEATEVPMVSVPVNPEQSQKALLPIEVTELGMFS
jgi:hypothetical protein